MPWQNSSGPQSAAPEPEPVLEPLAGGSVAGAEPLDEVGGLEAGVPDVAGAGVAGARSAPAVPSELVPEDNGSPPDSVAPEHAATRHAKTTRPARAGPK